MLTQKHDIISQSMFNVTKSKRPLCLHEHKEKFCHLSGLLVIEQGLLDNLCLGPQHFWLKIRSSLARTTLH